MTTNVRVSEANRKLNAESRRKGGQSVRELSAARLEDKILTPGGGGRRRVGSFVDLRRRGRDSRRRAAVVYAEEVERWLQGTPALLAVAAGMSALGYFFWSDAQQHAASAEPVVVPPLPSGATPDSASPLPQPLTPPASTIWGPRRQGAAAKPFIEGHWQGMELITLSPALATLYKIGPEVEGLLVDEVTLAAAESGLRAGDVITHLGDQGVGTLADLQTATFALRNHRHVELTVIRQGRLGSVVLRTPGPLGFAMFEGAPPIAPGAISPHKDRGQPCTDCHIIMKSGGQLAKDGGDLLPTPPVITVGTLCPHDNKGPCESCHTVRGAASAPR